MQINLREVISAQKTEFEEVTHRLPLGQGIAVRHQEFGCSLEIPRPYQEIEVEKYESILKDGETTGKDGPALKNDKFDAFPSETIQDPFKASLEEEIPRNVYLKSRFEICGQRSCKQGCEPPSLQMPKQQRRELSFVAQMVRNEMGLQVLEFI